MSNLHPECDRRREDTGHSPGPDNNLASARLIIEMDYGITVYPPETDGSPWRAVFPENGVRHFRQAATEELLAGKLEQVRLRLGFDAFNMERPGAELIAHT
jgi:hypothetical protein